MSPPTSQFRIPQLHSINTERQSFIQDRLALDTVNPTNLERRQAAFQSQRVSLVTALRQANCEHFLES